MGQASGRRTLLASVLLSAPGPLVVGAGLLLGRSSTQLADFIRRSAELAAIIVSWAVYQKTQNRPDPGLECVANRCVGASMLLGGMAMLAVAFWAESGEKGNVIPGLVIAVLGVLTNGWFWLRYRKLDRAAPNGILAVQAKLYRAKFLVDLCVSAALAAVAVAPTSRLAYYMDFAGSLAVALYLMGSGAAILKKPVATRD